jgi:hypothetical protein
MTQPVPFKVSSADQALFWQEDLKASGEPRYPSFAEEGMVEEGIVAVRHELTNIRSFAAKVATSAAWKKVREKKGKKRQKKRPRERP